MTIKLPNLYQLVGKEHRENITENNVTITSGKGTHVVNRNGKGKLVPLHQLFYYLEIQSICYISFSIPRYYSISLFVGARGHKIAAVRLSLPK